MIYVKVAIKSSAKSLFLYSVPGEMGGMLKVGSRVKVPLVSRKCMAVAVELYTGLPTFALSFKDKIKSISEIVDPSPLISEPLMDTAKWMSNFYLCPLSKCLFSILPVYVKSVDETPLIPDTSKIRTIEESLLSQEQQKVVKDVMSGGSLQYLYGKTGSGKTAVFFTLARRFIEEGKGVIYLVPEIALTSRTALEAYALFGNKVALLHSKMTNKKRLGEWKRVMRGEARMVIGARSAVFAPVQNLSLIIIDEEHESSYKAGNDPRYNARQVAMYRAKRERAKALMASATPSLESWKLMEEGKITRHVLTKRLAGGAESEITVVDMKNYPPATLFSPPLIKEIRDALNEKRSALLLLNRRGFTHTLECSSCSRQMKCKNCNVSLTYHKDKERLICHYCGYSSSFPEVCPSCGCLEFISRGYGTEFVEEESLKIFPNARIKRIDTDTADTQDGAEKAFHDFREGKIDILLGTKMIAKGFNFPTLKVVGVVLSDAMMSIPDFRAYESTFSLITQAAGRTGRFHPDGKVIIQTFMADNPLIKYLAKGETENFYAWEMERRKEQGFPPYSRLARLVFRSKSSEKAMKCAKEAAKFLRKILNEKQLSPYSAKNETQKEKSCEAEGKDLSFYEEGAASLTKVFSHGESSAQFLEKERRIYEATEILGSSPCPIDKIAKNYRYELILRGPSITHINKLIAEYFSFSRSKQSVYTEIDIDPVNFM